MGTQPFFLIPTCLPSIAASIESVGAIVDFDPPVGEGGQAGSGSDRRLDLHAFFPTLGVQLTVSSAEQPPEIVGAAHRTFTPATVFCSPTRDTAGYAAAVVLTRVAAALSVASTEEDAELRHRWREAVELRSTGVWRIGGANLADRRHRLVATLSLGPVWRLVVARTTGSAVGRIYATGWSKPTSPLAVILIGRFAQSEAPALVVAFDEHDRGQRSARQWWETHQRILQDEGFTQV